MISVVLIGYGNVSSHLVHAFLQSSNIELIQVYNRSINKIKHLETQISITNDFSELLDANIYIISVSDDAITEVSSKIIQKDIFVVHTSGANSISKLQNNGRKGVFYMLQSFSKNKNIDFKNTPFCLEAENEKDLQLLEELANELSNKVYKINSEQRQYLHVSAVFVNNFVNHLYKIGNDICSANNVPFEVLLPIIKETAQKIACLSPTQAQTGPARRGDEKTIIKHLSLLDTHQQEIYNLLSSSIKRDI